MSTIDTVALLAATHKGKTGENPHAHIVIQIMSPVQKQSMAVRMKKLFDVQKRSGYALDIWDGSRGSGACSYLFHEEDAEIIGNKGFSQQDLYDAKLANEAVQKVVAINKARASVRFVEKALDRFKGDDNVDEWAVLSYMCDLVRNGELYWPGEFKAKSMIQEVMLRSSTSTDYASSLWNKMFR